MVKMAKRPESEGWRAGGLEVGRLVLSEVEGLEGWRLEVD